MGSYLGISDILIWSTRRSRTIPGEYQALSGLCSDPSALDGPLRHDFGIAHLTGRAPFDFWRTVKHFVVMVLWRRLLRCGLL